MEKMKLNSAHLRKLIIATMAIGGLGSGGKDISGFDFRRIRND